MKDIKFKKTKLALSILGSSSVLIADPLLAQSDSQLLEEIVVTGIRQSLINAQELKRSSQGVVEGITAEDIGKFPDTNLAESLQRISGVSIDRANGEGSQVTVRGFGPDFNLVLLNGRQMPSAFLDRDGSSNSRSFDFANLASEAVSAVEIFKTSRASISTGGIGSTINIRTTRPLDKPGMVASLGTKLVIDDSVTSTGGGDTAPEISGIFSNTFADDTFGISASLSYQERKSGAAESSVFDGFRGAYLGSTNNWGTLPQSPDDDQVTNRPGANDIYSVAQSIRSRLFSTERERLNGQLTLQYQPSETFKATLDYFYAENSFNEEIDDLSIWFNFADTTSAWTDGPIAANIFYSEDFVSNGGAASDLTYSAARTGVDNESDSIGLNFEWQATDRLSLELDVHSSSAEAGANNPYGTDAVVSTADINLANQRVDFDGGIPALSFAFVDGGGLDPSRVVATGLRFGNSLLTNDIDQFKLSGNYDFDSSVVKSVDFGVEMTETSVRSAFANAQRNTWGGLGTAADLTDDIYSEVNLASNFDGFSGANQINATTLAIDFERLIEAQNNAFGPDCGGISGRAGLTGCGRSDEFLTDRRIEEESNAAFVQINMDFNDQDLPLELMVGLRYEATDVTSPAQVTVPTSVEWTGNNELSLVGLDDPNNVTTQVFTGEYKEWLPSIDAKWNLTDDVVLRASYSTTLTRPGYNDVAGGLVVNSGVRIIGGTASNGNTNLQPFLSDNIDISAEWYYKDDSYVSVGYFKKDVENFIGTGVLEDTVLFPSVLTPIGGARWDAAIAATGSDVNNPDVSAIREWIFANADPSTYRIDGIGASGGTLGAIFAVAGDPAVTFDVSNPVNQEDATLDGLEFAIQHVFDSGFGVQFNYTLVDGDIEFDVNRPGGGDPVFALLGLSDSFNVIGFYENERFQARIAYNWRDDFLTSTIGRSGQPNNPIFVKDFGQFDINASYKVNDNLTAFVEAINVTDETTGTYGRTEEIINSSLQTGPRYHLGLRYKF